MIVNYLGFALAKIDFPDGRKWAVAIPFGAIVGYSATLKGARKIARMTVIG